MKMDNLEVQRNLGEKEIAIFNGEMQRQKKSTVVSYLLLIFFGGIGGHKFYLGKSLWGALYLVLSIVGYSLFLGGIASTMGDAAGSGAGGGATIIGMLASAIVGILLLIDLFTLPLQMKRRDKKISDDLLAKLSTAKSA